MQSRTFVAIGILMATPIALALSSAGAQQAGGGSPPMGDLPPIWNVEFSIHDQARRTDAKMVIVRTTDFAGMEYDVRAMPDMRVESTGLLRGQFKMIMDFKGPEGHSDQVWQGLQSAKKTLPQPAWKPGETELLLGRRIELKNCQKLVDVQTAGSRNMRSNGKPNTFVISSNLNWTPTYWKSTIYEPRPQRTVTVPPMQDGGPIYTLPEQEVPYDFRKLVNNNNGATYTLQAYSFGGFQPVKRTINYTITRKPMSIQYGDPQVSLIGQLTDCKICKNQFGNPNYAKGEETGYLEEDGSTSKKGDRWTTTLRFIHGNVDLHLIIDGKDVTNFKMIEQGNTSTFSLVRLRRDWKWPLDENGVLILDKNGKPKGGLKPLSKLDNTRRFGNGWIEDHATPGNLKDMPGSFQDRPPAKWESERETKEFLVAVKDFPEFGFIYYAITFETRPGQFRFGQSQQAKQMKAEEWCDTIATPAAGPLEQPQFGQPVTRFIE